MKKITSIMMALMIVLGLSQCKKQVENNDNIQEVAKVRVSCTIPINDGGRSDFSNLMETGNVNWSDGRECVYLAVHGEDSQIIELEGWSDGTPSNLEFTGEVTEGLIITGEEYDIWYFGHSQQLATPYISNNGSTLTGSISNQSGRLADLGYCHIAKATVMAETDGEGVKLNLTGVLKNQIAIALLDLEDVTELYGNAIAGTEYTLSYNGERYELDVVEDSEAAIDVASASGISYVVLLPNEGEGVSIKHKKGEDTYSYTFRNGIESSKIYYRSGLDGTTPEALEWKEISEIDGHEYVDLGLTSGLLWATCNVGTNTPEARGNYYAWGETTTKAEYTEENYFILSNNLLNDISGNLQYDAAAANWGGAWRIPSSYEFNELLSECAREKTTLNGVDGYKFTGPNGNHIFLPATGHCDGSSVLKENKVSCWSSTISYSSGVTPVVYSLNEHLWFAVNGMSKAYYGQQIRPVTGGDFEGPAPMYATVTTSELSEITTNSAVCVGEVTTDNGSAVTERGVCWSMNKELPSITDNKLSSGSGVGEYTINLTGLMSNTIYYVRAYATNGAGTSYGESIKFTTLSSGSNVHEYVDLGLSVKWATCNVGAEIPEAYGNYYAWGETVIKEEYLASNCSTYGVELDDISGNPQYDAAAANWGNGWRMPTKAEQEELMNNCTWTWTVQNGVNGYKVTGQNGNHIFLPAAGRRGDGLINAGFAGYYWNSTPKENTDKGVSYIYFNDNNLRIDENSNRYYGQMVRPVIAP